MLDTKEVCLLEGQTEAESLRTLKTREETLHAMQNVKQNHKRLKYHFGKNNYPCFALEETEAQRL